jgi:hypothetical protein
LLGYPLPVPFQTLQDLLVAVGLYPGTGHDHDVQALQSGLMPAEAFPNQALDPVSIHRQLEVFLADGQPQSGQVQVVGSGEHRQYRIRRADRPVKDVFEIARFQQSLVPGEIAAGSAQAELYGQALTALGTTAFDHQTAGLGLHARTETMGTFALEITGLKCPLHDNRFPELAS